MAVKTCKICKEEKDIIEFRKIKGKYHRSKCRSCEAAYSKEYIEKNKSLLSDSKQRYYYENKEAINKKLKEKHRKDPRINMLSTAKHRAKRTGVPFDLELEDILIPDICPILRIKLFVGDDKSHKSSPSLDKIVPELGYVKGNIQVISKQANSMKYNANIDELLLFADWILLTFKKGKYE